MTNEEHIALRKNLMRDIGDFDIGDLFHCKLNVYLLVEKNLVTERLKFFVPTFPIGRKYLHYTFKDVSVFVRSAIWKWIPRNPDLRDNIPHVG